MYVIIYKSAKLTLLDIGGTRLLRGNVISYADKLLQAYFPHIPVEHTFICKYTDYIAS